MQTETSSFPQIEDAVGVRYLENRLGAGLCCNTRKRLRARFADPPGRKILSLHSTNGTSKRHRRRGAPHIKPTAPCVLLVDEDRTVRALFATSLKDLGFRILTAGNGEEALQILRAKPSVDVVVTEVALPVMGGLELLRTVRRTIGLKTLPVILCSVAIDETTTRSAVEYGCDLYLSKPVHPEFLAEQISSLLHPKISRRNA